jgi:hypothetical protein
MLVEIALESSMVSKSQKNHDGLGATWLRVNLNLRLILYIYPSILSVPLTATYRLAAEYP